MIDLAQAVPGVEVLLALEREELGAKLLFPHSEEKVPSQNIPSFESD